MRSRSGREGRAYLSKEVEMGVVGSTGLRILHFGDVHLPFPEGALRDFGVLHPKRLVALLNYSARRARKYAESAQKLDGLCDFLRREPVDWILYTGDMLNQGLEKEYMEAAEPLARVLGMARGGALAVPGNHDLYTRASVGFYRRLFGPRLPKGDLPEMEGKGGYPCVRFMGEDAVAIGLNSAVPHFAFWDSSGRLDGEEVAALGRLLDSPEVARRRWVFVMTHYPFLDTDWLHGLRGTEAFWKVLEGRKNVVLLHGHNHRNYVAQGPGGVPVYCCGSLSKRDAESFWLFEPFAGALNARRGVWRNARFSLEAAEAGEAGG